MSSHLMRQKCGTARQCAPALWCLLIALALLRLHSCSARFLSQQASASQPPLPPALGGAPAAAPEVVVHDEDDTPMPVAITADETNLFQVGGQGGWG